MAYYVSADGGGTKLTAILFTDELEYVCHGLSGSTNTNFAPLETVRGHMRECMQQTLASRPELECLYYAIVGPGKVFVEETQRITSLKAHEALGEGGMALLAGAGVLEGMLALSGTGSDVFMLLPGGKRFTIGGWGSVLGDEGSGYDIGCSALRAAIYAYDGRGPHTELLPMLMEEWKLTALWDMVVPLYGDPQIRRKVASVAKLVSRAAHMGDEVALNIYRSAAFQLARCAKAAIAKCGGAWEGPIVAGGSAWKGHPIMFETFKQLLKEDAPRATFSFPLFEPVMGGVVKVALSQGRKPQEFMPLLKERFAQFLYQP